MSQPAPKGQFIQILLIGATVFLGFSLFTQKGPPDTRPVSEILTKMRTMNSQVLDVSIVGENSRLDSRINEEVEKKTLGESDAKRLRIEGSILVANTQFRAGVNRKDFNRVNTAFTTLQPLERSMQIDPVWTQSKVKLGPHHKYPIAEYTGQEMYKAIVDDLSARSKTDLLYGIVPGYQVIDVLVQATGKLPGLSYWLAALLLAAVVRIAVFPLAQKQYMFGRQMSQLSPLLAEIKEQYTDKKTKQVINPQEFQKRTMELYGEYGINPMAGCFPALIQIPFFLLIYNCMLHYQFEFQKGVFAWINPTMSQATGGFIAPNLGQRDYILIGIYAISMIVTTMLAPISTSDPAQAKQQKWIGIGMSVLFSVIMFFWPLPSAFVLYWVFLNVFATMHMLYAYRLPAPPLQKVNAPGGGTFPLTPKPQSGGSNGKSSVKPSKGTGTPVKHRPKKK